MDNTGRCEDAPKSRTRATTLVPIESTVFGEKQQQVEMYLRNLNIEVDGVCITDSPEQRQNPVFDCREHSEDSMELWRAGSAAGWRLVPGADGPCYRGGSELNPGSGEP